MTRLKVSEKGRVPQRTCLGCGARDDQDRLIRLAVMADDQLLVERHHGRGGYLHRDPKCHKAFVSRKGEYRAFRVEINRRVKAQFIEQLASRNWE